MGVGGSSPLNPTNKRELLQLSFLLQKPFKSPIFRAFIRIFVGSSCEKGQESIFKGRLKLWERIFLEEGEAGFYIERRGRKRKMDNPKKGRPKKKLDKQVKQDLIAENQQLKERVEQLEMENEYLKKLDALVRKRLQNQKKK